jgi:hypothetical protein
MPALGMAQDSGLIVAWRKKPGDPVAASDVLLEVETDKSVMEVEAGHDGFVAAILADAQQAVPVGSVIAIISAAKPENAVARSHKSTPAQDDEASGAATDKAPPAAGERPRTGAVPVSGGRILASPKTRRLAREKGLDLNLLVENGVPQPYHVSDLGLLETLVPSTKAAGASASRAAAGALPMHIGARVAASGCDEFIAWLADGGGVHLEPRLLWLRFAAAAFREATGLGDKTLVVEARTDRARLSKPVSDAGDQVPSIVLRDFTGSPITTATGSSSDSPSDGEREDYGATRAVNSTMTAIEFDRLRGPPRRTSETPALTGANRCWPRWSPRPSHQSPMPTLRRLDAMPMRRWTQPKPPTGPRRSRASVRRCCARPGN